MMKNIFCLLFISFTLFINAQITYEKGYFIDNDNNRTECYIKNIDWRTSPSGISYRSTSDANSKEVSISEIREFYIYDTEHYYKRFNLSIDKTVVTDFNDDSRKLKYEDNVVIFLRVLVEGDANLYEFPGSRIFFYNTSKIDIQQLEYKVYISEESIKKENTDYQKKLYETLKCDKFSTDRFLKIEYNREDLINLFSDYNECQDADYKTYQINQTPFVFSVNATLGVNFTSLETDYTLLSFDSSEKFDSQVIFTPGIELELALPFNKNKWAVFVGASYHYYKESKEDVVIMDTNLGDLTFEYSYLEIPMGIKHYMYLNSEYKLYLSAALAPILHLSNNNDEPFERNDEVQGEITFQEKNSSKNSAYIFGVGINIMSKYSIGLNYYASKEINNSKDFSNNMNGAISLVASYKIF